MAAPAPASSSTVASGATLTATDATASSLWHALSTIAPSNTVPASALPTAPDLQPPELINPPQASAVAVFPFKPQTYSYMQTCCNGAPIVVYNSGYQAYCLPQGQSLSQLMDCYYLDGTSGNNALPGINGVVASGEGDGNPQAVFTVSVPTTTTGGPTSSSTTAAATSATSSGAAAAGRLVGSQRDAKGFTVTGLLVVACLLFGAVL